MSAAGPSLVDIVVWASFGLRMLAVLCVVAVALAIVRKAQPAAAWMLAGAVVIEALDMILWQAFALSIRHLSTSFEYVLVPLRLVSMALGLAVGALVVMGVWRLAKTVPRS